MERANPPQSETAQELEPLIAGVIDDVLSLRLESMESTISRSVNDKISALADAQRAVLERLDALGLAGRQRSGAGDTFRGCPSLRVAERVEEAERRRRDAEARLSTMEQSLTDTAAQTEMITELKEQLAVTLRELEAVRGKDKGRDREKALAEERKRLQDQLLAAMTECDDWRKKYEDARKQSGGATIKGPDGKNLSTTAAETLIREAACRSWPEASLSWPSCRIWWSTARRTSSGRKARSRSCATPARS